MSVYMYVLHHSSISDRLGHLHLLAVEDHAALELGLHVSFGIPEPSHPHMEIKNEC